mmetsp:Transcript_8831/g.18317  ORF Transcript_8831/g.18317 Transcript_8831/m.18317 type:complete len:210 (-) Transcript_8831:518-1147(-)
MSSSHKSKQQKQQKQHCKQDLHWILPKKANNSTMMMMRLFTAFVMAMPISMTSGFTTTTTTRPVSTSHAKLPFVSRPTTINPTSSTQLAATTPDLDVIALVAGQENYGFALVALGEGVYSFLQAPNFSNIKVLLPPVVGAVLLAAVSGPMITSGDAAAVGTGLWIATGTSLALGASYMLRLLAPPSDTFVPKEVRGKNETFLLMKERSL